MKKTGIVGAVFVAVCCVTPLLPILMGALGMGGFVAVVYTDWVLFPALAFFMMLAGFGFLKRKKHERSRVGNYLSVLPPQICRDRADGRLPVFL